MTDSHTRPEAAILVAVDIAKDHNEVLIELRERRSQRRRFRVANTLEEYERLVAYLRQFDTPALFGFEATGNYHRPLAYFLHARGFELRLIPTMALARTREAMHNSWDKNDPKDAQVILHLLKARLTQHYHDPIVHNLNDVGNDSRLMEQGVGQRLDGERGSLSHRRLDPAGVEIDHGRHVDLLSVLHR